MSLGFSRFTALKLKSAINWGNADGIEDYLSIISKTNTSALALPRVCLKEISDIFGSQ
jgi:hypothetical protein